MSMNKPKFKRLFKVASEFNSSTSSIVDILSTKGHEIDNKPNSKVNREMLDVLNDYFDENNTTKSPLKSSNLDLDVKHETIEEGDTQVDFKSLFNDHLDSKTESIVIVDPYIRLPYQIKNLMHFIKFILDTIDNINDLNIKLITSNKDEYKKFTRETLEKISENLSELEVDFDFQLDDSIHDRFVKIDNKWKVTLGRGLDIYQESKLTELSNYDLKLRSCKGFSVTYLPKGHF